MSTRTLMIGDLARLTGTKVNTIRFYESIGLMTAAPRTGSGRRTYSEADVRRLSFIRHARELGFETEEIRSLLALDDQPDRNCDEARAIAKHHLVQVEGKVARLLAMRGELEAMIDGCRADRIADCGIMEALAAYEPTRSAARPACYLPGLGAASG